MSDRPQDLGIGLARVSSRFILLFCYSIYFNFLANMFLYDYLIRVQQVSSKKPYMVLVIVFLNSREALEKVKRKCIRNALFIGSTKYLYIIYFNIFS